MIVNEFLDFQNVQLNEILLCIMKNPSITKKQVSKKLGMPVANTFRLISKLYDAGFLDVESSKEQSYRNIVCSEHFTSKYKKVILEIDAVKGIRLQLK